MLPNPALPPPPEDDNSINDPEEEGNGMSSFRKTTRYFDFRKLEKGAQISNVANSHPSSCLTGHSEDVTWLMLPLVYSARPMNVEAISTLRSKSVKL
eukprot:1332930-Amorphochlora_amoeboformis.AAC.1